MSPTKRVRGSPSKVQRSKSQAKLKSTKVASNDSDGPEYAIERILDSRKNAKGREEYFVKWTGFGDSDNTWEPAENLDNCASLIKQYKDKKQHEKKEPKKVSKADLEEPDDEPKSATKKVPRTSEKPAAAKVKPTSAKPSRSSAKPKQRTPSKAKVTEPKKVDAVTSTPRTSASPPATDDNRLHRSGSRKRELLVEELTKKLKDKERDLQDSEIERVALQTKFDRALNDLTKERLENAELRAKLKLMNYKETTTSLHLPPHKDQPKTTGSRRELFTKRSAPNDSSPPTVTASSKRIRVETIGEKQGAWCNDDDDDDFDDAFEESKLTDTSSTSSLANADDKKCSIM